MPRSIPNFEGHVKHLQILLEACRTNDPALWSNFCEAQGPQFSADLRGADLRGKDLSGFKLKRSRLQGADFSGANLSGADLTDCHLAGSQFNGTVLNGAKLPRPKITTAKSHVPGVEDSSKRYKTEQIQQAARLILEERKSKKDEAHLRHLSKHPLFRVMDEDEED